MMIQYPMAESPKYRRRAMTRKEVLEILAQQGVDVAEWPPMRKETEIWTFIERIEIAVPCGNCREPIRKRSECIRDHKISLRSVDIEQRRDHDQAWNQWYLCLSCNDTKTHKRGLKGLGSDASRHARLRRIEKGKPLCPKRKAKIRSRPFPKNCKTVSTPSFVEKRKIPSRPFPKAAKKPE